MERWNAVSIRSEVRTTAILIVIVLVSLSVLLPSLPNGFIDDDQGLTINAPQQRLIQPGQIIRIRSETYRLLYRFFGLNPAPFRFLNILFHEANVILLFSIVRSVLPLPIALLSAAWFAVHPVVLDPVIWISGGVYPQASFFFLTALFLYIRHGSTMHTRIGTYIAWLLTVLTWEKFLHLGLVFYAYDVVFRSIRRQWRPLLVLSTISVSIMVLTLPHVQIRYQFARDFGYGTQTWSEAARFVSTTLSRQISLVFVPINLGIFASKSWFPILPWPAWTVMSVIALALTGLGSWRKKSKGLQFFFIATGISLMQSLAWFLRPTPGAIRYMYLPYAFLIPLTLGLLFMLGKSRRWQVIIGSASIALILGFALRAYTRIADYRNERSWRLAAVRDASDNPESFNFLGTYYYIHGDYSLASQAYETALSLEPNHFQALHNLGLLSEESGDNERALRYFEKALETNPYSWKTHLSAGLAYARIHNYHQAITYFSQALELHPNDPELYLLLARVYHKTGNVTEAKSAYEQVIKLQPDHPQAHAELKRLPIPENSP